MILQTGGFALDAISTRSRPRFRASWIASRVSIRPSVPPSSRTTRTEGTRMRSFVRCCGSRNRGLNLFPPNLLAITPPFVYILAATVRTLFIDLCDEFFERNSTEVAYLTVANRDLSIFKLLIPEDKHIWDLLQLSIADLCPDLVAA